MTYAYEKPDAGPGSYVMFASKNMVEDHRMQFVAKLTRDLVVDVRDQCVKNGVPGCLRNLSQITMLGFSLGAHIASQACVYLYQKTGEKVGKLFGIDPAGMAFTLWKNSQSFIKQGDAAYVQIIHTDALICGTMFVTGDVDIFVYDIPMNFGNLHHFAVYLHISIAMKKLLLIAESWGKGQLIKLDGNSTQENRVLKDNEVIVGVYSEAEDKKRDKRFRISFKNRGEILRDSIADVVKMRLG